MGILVLRALFVGVCIRAARVPEFLKPPNIDRSDMRWP